MNYNNFEEYLSYISTIKSGTKFYFYDGDSIKYLKFKNSDDTSVRLLTKKGDIQTESHYWFRRDFSSDPIEAHLKYVKNIFKENNEKLKSSKKALEIAENKNKKILEKYKEIFEKFPEEFI